jgi:hypothetical protein
MLAVSKYFSERAIIYGRIIGNIKITISLTENKKM